MFALGIPKRQYRRTTQVLGPYMSTPTSYDAVKQDDGFYLFTFPDADEDKFRDIGSPFPGTDNPFMDDDDDRSPGEELADRTIEKLRQQYRGMSDQDMDDFSVAMIKHFLDNVEAKNYARKNLNTTTSRLDTL